MRSLLGEVPFVLRKNTVTLEVRIGKDAESAVHSSTRHFILDTGAGNSILTREVLVANKIELAGLLGDAAKDAVVGFRGART